MTLPVSKIDPQGCGSAISYMRRYALAAVVGVVQADDDGNAAVASVKASPKVDVSSQLANGDKIASEGTAALTAWWKTLSPDVRNAIPATKTAEWKKTAADATLRSVSA